MPLAAGQLTDIYAHGRPVDPEGADVGVGSEGELCLAGDGVMSGYWGRPEETANAFHVDDAGTRWYRTGDVVRRDDAGLLRFLGDVDAGAFQPAAG